MYGSAVPLSGRDPYQVPAPEGYGTLFDGGGRAIARDEHGSGKILVISGVGTRYYYESWATV